MTIVKRLASALIVAAIPGTALAADPPRRALSPPVVEAPKIDERETFYVALRGGIASLEPTQYRIASLTTPPQTDIVSRYGASPIGLVALGFDFGETFDRFSSRIELEFGFQANPVTRHNRIQTSPPPTIVVATPFTAGDLGRTSSFQAMLNYYLDFTGFGRFKPFVGAGLGVANVVFDRHQLGPGNFTMSDRDTKLAVMATAGLAFDVNETITLDLAYRFFRVSDVNITTRDSANANVSTMASFTSHQILAGLRFRF